MKRTFELHEKTITGKECAVTEIHLDTKKLTDYVYNQLINKGRALDDIIGIHEYDKQRAKDGFLLRFPRVQVRLDNGFEYDAHAIYSEFDDKYVIEPIYESFEYDRELCRQIMIYDENDVREFRKTYELIAEVFVEIKNAKQEMVSALCKIGNENTK